MLCGPAPLVPTYLSDIAPGVSIEHDIEKAIAGADVIMMLRVQLERQHETPMPAGEAVQNVVEILTHRSNIYPQAIVRTCTSLAADAAVEGASA